MADTNQQQPPKALEHDPSLARPLVVGGETVANPYPIRLRGTVEKGFGRGSKDLGTPTANLPDSAVENVKELETGVHFGYARLRTSQEGNDCAQHNEVYPMVMSIGWNPFYGNAKRTAEVHVMHSFPQDFYGQDLCVIVLGFIRPEYNYSNMDDLIKDIETDKQVAIKSLDRAGYQSFQQDSLFVD